MTGFFLNEAERKLDLQSRSYRNYVRRRWRRLTGSLFGKSNRYEIVVHPALLFRVHQVLRYASKTCVG